MRVRDIMTRKLRTIAPTATVAEASEIMGRYGIEHLILVDRGRPIGVISDDDVRRIGADTLVHDVAQRRIVTIDGNASISRAANTMRGRQIDSLVVIEEGKLAGIVTTSDLLEVVGRSAGHPERMVLRDRGPRRHRHVI